MAVLEYNSKYKSSLRISKPQKPCHGVFVSRDLFFAESDVEYGGRVERVILSCVGGCLERRLSHAATTTLLSLARVTRVEDRMGAHTSRAWSKA